MDGGPNGNTNGGGGGGGGNTSLQVTGPRLLTTSARNGDAAILTFRRDSTLTGDVAPAAILNGTATDLGSVYGMAINSAGQLVAVCAQLDLSRNRECTINIFADATRLNGDQLPIRQVSMTGVNAFLLNTAVLDRSRDILYVSHTRAVNNIQTNFILVYENTMSDSFRGARGPDREFRCAGLRGSSDLAIDEAADQLHVADFDGQRIVVFDNASSRNGEAMDCDRSYGFGGNPAGLTVLDSGEVVGLNRSSNQGFIVRFDPDNPSVHALDLEIENSLFARHFAIDSAGTAYVSDSSPNRLHIFTGVMSRMSGKFTADRLVSGSTAGLGNSGSKGSAILLIAD